MTLTHTDLMFLTPKTLYDHRLPLTPPLPNHTLHGKEGGGGGGEGRLVGKVVYLSVLSVVIVLGNILVIASIVLVRTMHRVCNYFLLSMATADLMVGAVTIPLFILWLTNHDIFTCGLTCHMVLLSCLFVMAASQLNVIAVTTERYMAVCHPFYHRHLLLSRPHSVVMAIAALWLTSLAATALSSLAIAASKGECRYYSYFNRWFLLAVVLVGVFLPFAFIVVLNLRMLLKIRSSCLFKQAMYQRRGSSSSGGLLMSKATSMVMTVCCLFLLAWTPFFIVILIHSFCSACQLRGALDLILLFAFTNSAWNPVIYALCNLMFRSAYRQIFAMCCCPFSSPASRRNSLFLPLQSRGSSSNRSA